MNFIAYAVLKINFCQKLTKLNSFFLVIFFFMLKADLNVQLAWLSVQDMLYFVLG